MRDDRVDAGLNANVDTIVPLDRGGLAIDSIQRQVTSVKCLGCTCKTDLNATPILPMPPPKPTHLSPSELGTKEYWDTTYAHDLTTTAHTPSHTGHDWFSDANASQKILRYLTSPALNLDKRTTSFLDLGCGNGEMLFLLRDEGGFEGRMVGVDYSEASVKLCRGRMGALRVDEPGVNDVYFETWDILHQAPDPSWNSSGFDVVLDKGTFDAISLNEEVDAEGKRMCEGYREKVEAVVKKGGLVVVTSCNWTEEELGEWFEGGELEKVGRLEYPIFKFGGSTGQSISTVCFRRKTGEVE